MSKEAAMAILAATPAPDAPATGTPQADAPVADALVSSRIAQIAKKEAKYQAEVEAHKKQIAEFQERQSKFDPFFKRYQEFEEMKAKDPVAAIKMLGFNDTDFINYVAAQEDKSTPEERATKIAQTEIQKFKAEQEAERKKEAEARNDAALSEFRKEIGSAVKADPEKLEYCNYFGEEAEKLIYETINAALIEDRKTNPEAEMLSLAEAADLVEKYYEERDKAMMGLKKRKPAEPKIEEAAAEPEPVKEEPLRAEVSARPPVKTLTNRVGAPPLTTTIKKRETVQEKRERLINQLRGGA